MSQLKILSIESIRKKAYDLYLSRDSQPGNDLNDWFAAERELIFEQLLIDACKRGPDWSK